MKSFNARARRASFIERRALLACAMLACAGTCAAVAGESQHNSAPARISAARWDTLLLRTDGSVWSCSASGDYTEGVGWPYLERPAGSTRWISAGREHTYADTEVKGNNIYGEIGIDPTIASFENSYTYVAPVSGDPVAGFYVTYFITPQHTLKAAGDNRLGQLGNPLVAVSSSTFLTVKKSDGTPLTQVRDVAAGSAIGMAVDESGSVWTWGDNSYGELGDGTLNQRSFAAKVRGLRGIVAVSASTGRYQPPPLSSSPIHDHVLALDEDGYVWAWGENRDGEAGNGTRGIVVMNPLTDSDPVTRPVHVLIGPNRPLTGVVAISAGGAHSLALRSDGTVWSWGYDGSGQLGDGTYHDGMAFGTDGNPLDSYAREVPGLKDIASIATGPAESFAVDRLGHAWSWGWNAHGTLCQGPENDPNDGASPANNYVSPTRIQNQDGTPFDLGASKHSD